MKHERSQVTGEANSKAAKTQEIKVQLTLLKKSATDIIQPKTINISAGDYIIGKLK